MTIAIPSHASFAGQATPANTFTFTLGWTPADGSKLLVAFGVDASGTPTCTNVNDGTTTVTTPLITGTAAIGSGTNAIWVFVIDHAHYSSHPTINVVMNSGYTFAVNVLEITGAAVGQTSAILDGTANITHWHAAASATDPTLTTANSTSMVFQVLMDNFDGATLVAPTGYTASEIDNSAVTGSNGTAWRAATGGSEAGADFTWSGNTDAMCTKFAILVAGGGTVTPSLPIPFNPSWLILHQAGFEAVFQQPTPLTLTSIPASPTAGIATVNVGAFNPTVALTGLPNTPNVTAAGLAALPLLTALPDTPNVTVAGLGATVNIAGDANANAGLANVNAAALNVTIPVVTALPQSSNVTVGANLPSASTTGLTVVGAQFPISYLLAVYGTAIIQVPLTQSGTNDTALPQSTNVTVAAFGAAPALTGLPPVAPVTATSLPPTAALTGLPDTPNVTAAGLAPTQSVTVFAQVAAVTVAAYNPSVNVGGNVNVTPGVGNVVAAALNASVTAQGNVTASAQLAAVTVAAIGPSTTVNPTVTVAAVVIAAFVASPKVGGSPPAANVTVVASVLNVSGTGAHIGTLTASSTATATLTADDSSSSSQNPQDDS